MRPAPTIGSSFSLIRTSRLGIFVDEGGRAATPRLVAVALRPNQHADWTEIAHVRVISFSDTPHARERRGTIPDRADDNGIAGVSTLQHVLVPYRKRPAEPRASVPICGIGLMSGKLPG